MDAVAKPVYSVSVRGLVEFVLRRGDLGGERDFAGSDRAQAGIRGHQKLQRSRPDGYIKELPVQHDLQTADFTLRIQGRVDGLMIENGQVVLEEIKTVNSLKNHDPDPLHWAQARCYGFIHAHDHSLDQIIIQLTYLDLETGKVAEFREPATRLELAGFFAATAQVYLAWIHDLHAWRRQRDDSIRALKFPFAGFRPGQRKLSVAAYRTMAKGGRLFVEAPTGIGKTISALFPAVKAQGEGKLDRIFYLTSRTIARVIAEKAFNDMRETGLKLRTLTLTARTKMCVRDEKSCDVVTCPLAIGYYDRRNSAMRAALQREEINRPVLETIGREHQVCPYELSMDVSMWVDAIIGDYNYVFDPQAFLRRHFESATDHVFLVDEAHNLPDRAREMFSSELAGQEIQEIKRAIHGVPRLTKALSKLHSALLKLNKSVLSLEDFSDDSPSADEFNFQPKKATVQNPPSAQADEIQTLKSFPDDLRLLIEAALKEAEWWLVQNRPAEFRDNLLEFYFHLASFRRTADLFDEHYVIIVNPVPAVRVKLFCLDPSLLLREILDRGKAAVFFSATLSPLEYYRAQLGGHPEDTTLQLPSPFPPENLLVLIHDGIQTRYKARSESVVEVAETIAAMVKSRRGNYLVYFPSYEYLGAVLRQFEVQCPQVSNIIQRPGMTESEREKFLSAFAADHVDTLVGFAVMGGIFGEGIDLVGDRLIGVIVVGVGLPKLNAERDLMRNYFQHTNLSGFDYAYMFPGMNRVLQALGRVIRSETDRGLVLLIDQRFSEAKYRRLFPVWWRIKKVKNAAETGLQADSFWKVPQIDINFSRCDGQSKKAGPIA